VRSAITDTAVVTGRNLRHFIRQPDLLTFSTIQPVLFVLLFVYVFGGAVGRSLPYGVAYVDFLLPGIFVQSVTFGASQTAVGLSEDLQRGVVDRFRSMPMARSAVLAGPARPPGLAAGAPAVGRCASRGPGSGRRSGFGA
jgi:ABC-2 type transport system permease protein/oleandomycin transport system permease protein